MRLRSIWASLSKLDFHNITYNSDDSGKANTMHKRKMTQYCTMHKDSVHSLWTMLNVIPEHPLSWMLQGDLFSFSEEKLANVEL